MYDMTRLRARYFTVKLKNHKVLDVEPPKLKVFREISKITKNVTEFGEDEIDNLTRAVSLALSKNRQNYKISLSQVEEWFNYDELYDLLIKYFSWVQEVTNSKN